MNFLFIKGKRPIGSLFLTAIAIELVFVGLFMFLPVKTFADDFFVITQFPTRLNKRMSILSGFVSSYGDKEVYVWFEYGRNGKFEKSSDKSKVIGKQDFISYIHNLEPEVVYSYRAAARRQNSSTIKYGDTKTFIIEDPGGRTDTYEQQTNSSSVPANTVSAPSQQTTFFVVKPVASSGSSVEITSTSVELHSTILSGGFPVRGWFEWGATKSLGRVTPAKKLGNAPRIEMKETVYGLSPNTTYYYRSVAVNDKGVDRGVIMSFATQPSDGVVTKEVKDQEPAEPAGLGPVSGSGPTDKTGVTELISKEDSLENFLGWGSALREQFFTVDKEGHIVTSTSFDEEKNDKQNFLLAGTIFGKKILPDTWSEWGCITIFLYFIISQLNYFFVTKKKKKKEKKEIEKELQEARDMQFVEKNSGEAPA